MNGALQIHPKIAGASLSGALSLIVIYVLGRFNITVTPDVAGAISVIFSFAGGYLSPALGTEKPGPTA